LQVKNFIDGKLKMLSDDFYFNLNNDFSNLYERIFSCGYELEADRDYEREAYIEYLMSKND